LEHIDATRFIIKIDNESCGRGLAVLDAVDLKSVNYLLSIAYLLCCFDILKQAFTSGALIAQRATTESCGLV
jgi:hypothetical protein